VIPRVDGDNNSDYLTALQRGVAHYAGTALPGENSNIFIFGHSNFSLNDPGKYKRIFAQLNQLKSGDLVKIHYQQREHRFLVSQIRLVSPHQVEIIKSTKRERLTLMTCWPPGTTDQRLIVICKKE
jgi:sortase A